MRYVVRNKKAGIIFKQKGTSCKEKELHVNLTSNTFQRKYENLIKTSNTFQRKYETLTVLIYPKIT